MNIYNEAYEVEDCIRWELETLMGRLNVTRNKAGRKLQWKYSAKTGVTDLERLDIFTTVPGGIVYNCRGSTRHED